MSLSFHRGHQKEKSLSLLALLFQHWSSGWVKRLLSQMAGFPKASQVVSLAMYLKEGRRGSVTSLTTKHVQFQEIHRTGFRERTGIVPERDGLGTPKYGHVF